ncbi:hypothetical protein [Streptomyces tremellae]|uniref:Uncharacterized protein n=1 Tax=Streptomyces tremellae TaxID=1124239 RepID=A0ABP7EFC0_9ACTN
MTTATPVPLANRPQEQHDMPQPTATAGARVRVTFDDQVHHLTDGTVFLASGTRIDPATPGIHIAVLEPGYQPGDQAHDGTAPLFRVAPPDAPAYWISPDGRIVGDHEVHPAQLRITRAPAEQGSEAQQ